MKNKKIIYPQNLSNQNNIFTIKILKNLCIFKKIFGIPIFNYRSYLILSNLALVTLVMRTIN